MRHGGGRGASRGDTWQSRSAETNGDDAALTPTRQTALEISPGYHKVKLRNRNLEKASVSLYESDTENERKEPVELRHLCASLREI